MPGGLIIDVEDGSVKFNNTPVTDQDRRRIGQRELKKGNNDQQNNELSDFYVPVTDEEREANAPQYSVAELQEIRCRSIQAIKRAPGIFSVDLPALSDFFQNRVPEKAELWPTGHPMAFEVSSCLKPIILSEMQITTDYLQEEMQTRGAFMLRVEENKNPLFWDLVFYLDSRFYARVTLESRGGIPLVVAELIQKEREKQDALLKNKENLADPRIRTKILHNEFDKEITKGMPITDEEEEEEEAEERLEREESEAKDAVFRLSGIRAKVMSFYLYMAD